MKDELFVGVDPSGSAMRPSGICIINRSKKVSLLGRWNTFKDIEKLLLPFREKICSIGIDGPLQPPHELDRCCFTRQSDHCSHKQTGKYKGRYCEYLLIKKGYRCFLTSKDSFVKTWVSRCFRLNEILTALGFRTIEVFPYAARKILFPDLPGKKYQRSFRQQLQKCLSEKGYILPEPDFIYSHDELDAVLAAVTSRLHFLGQAELVGDERDGYIVIPRLATLK